MMRISLKSHTFTCLSYVVTTSNIQSKLLYHYLFILSSCICYSGSCFVFLFASLSVVFLKTLQDYFPIIQMFPLPFQDLQSVLKSTEAAKDQICKTDRWSCHHSCTHFMFKICYSMGNLLLLSDNVFSKVMALFMNILLKHQHNFSRLSLNFHMKLIF